MTNFLKVPTTCLYMSKVMTEHSVERVPSKHFYKSIAGRYRPVRVADGPITARYRFIKNAGSVSYFCYMF